MFFYLWWKQGKIKSELESLGVTEYEYCLERALELLKEDTWDDIDVVLKTRNRNYSELPSEINSLHTGAYLNAANKKAQGSEVLYCRASSTGKKMAEIIQNNLVKRLNLADRGAKPREKKEAGGHILWSTKAPCVIVESFFLDSTREFYEKEVYEALRTSIREIVDRGE